MQGRIGSVPRPKEFYPSPNEAESMRGDMSLILLNRLRNFLQVSFRGSYAR